MNIESASKFAIDSFTKAMGREPTPHEQKWVGRWEPNAAVRLAALNPEGAPDTLVSIKIPDMWEGVSLYAELTVSALPFKNGIVTGFRSLRYHDGDDSLWPMRDANGELVRSDGGHLLRSPTFRAPRMNVEPVSECTWPSDVQNRGMWHLETFIRPIYTYIGNTKRPPKHLIVEPHPAVKLPEAPARERELERRIAELENALTKRRT